MIEPEIDKAIEMITSVVKSMQNNFGKSCIQEIVPAYWNKEYFKK